MSLHLGDLHAGMVFASAPQTVTRDEILAFAREFDPQPFHTDEAAAQDTLFGRLVASGWHTGALTMRMLTATLDLAGGVIGMGVEDLRLPAPLLPGDTIRLQAEVLHARASATRPTHGIVRIAVKTVRDDGAVLQAMVANLLVPRRPEHVPSAH